MLVIEGIVVLQFNFLNWPVFRNPQRAYEHQLRRYLHFKMSFIVLKYDDFIVKHKKAPKSFVYICYI